MWDCTSASGVERCTVSSEGYLLPGKARQKEDAVYITDDETVVAGSIVYVLGKKNSMNAVEVVSVEKYAEDDVPEPIEKTPRIIRKCHEDELLLPEGNK